MQPAITNHSYPYLCRYWVSNPRGWTLYSVAMVCINIITGFFFAFKRFVLLTALSVVAVCRLDCTIFPDSIVTLDTGFSSFMALLAISHRHRSPIISIFVRLCQDISNSNSNSNSGNDGNSSSGDGVVLQTSNRRKCRRNKWHLLYTLLNNPSLIELRRHTHTPLHSELEGCQEVKFLNPGVEKEKDTNNNHVDLI